MKLIDLSVLINSDTPVYPGDPKVEVESIAEVDKDGYEVHALSIATHVGTHMDAPRHMVSGAKTLDQFEPEKFMGRGVCIRVQGAYSMETVKNENIQAGDIVLFWTDMNEVYDKGDYFEKYPAMSEEVANYLVSKQVKIVGFDAAGPDHDPFPVHKILLKNEILIIENLTNLAALEGKEFTVYAFPIKLQVDGAPVRVIAQVATK